MSPPSHVTAASLRALGFVHGFSARPLDLGLDTASPDHLRLASLAGYDRARLRVCKQVHGAEVLDGVPPDEARERLADALIARAPGDLVGVRVADCAPILLADPSTGAVGAVHAGWRGVVAGVIPRALGVLGGSSVVAAVGPCIGPCCFEVGDDVAAEIAGASAPEVVRRSSGARPRVDLPGAVAFQLAAAGVREVERVGGCTYCDGARWHSYRRDGTASGRMLGFIRAGSIS